MPRGERGRGCGRGSSTASHAADQSSFVAGLLPCSPEEAGSADHLLWMQLEGHLELISAGGAQRPAAKSWGLVSSSSYILSAILKCADATVCFQFTSQERLPGFRVACALGAFAYVCAVSFLFCLHRSGTIHAPSVAALSSSLWILRFQLLAKGGVSESF